MEARFLEHAETVGFQALIDVLKTHYSGESARWDSMAFQRHIMIVTGRACLNFVASGLPVEQGLRTFRSVSLAAGVVGLSIIVPMMHVVAASSEEEMWENMSLALRLFVCDCARFYLLTDLVPELVLNTLA